jgi:hypothetical protein
MKTYTCLNCSENHTITHYFQPTTKYCSTDCQREYQTKQRIENWKLTGVTGTKTTQTPGWLKRYLLEKQDGKCFKCGIKDWCNEPIVFDLEHIDGNSDNNKEENLCCLCPNCHSQTPTYKAKNKGNGRHSRRERYKEGKSF